MSPAEIVSRIKPETRTAALITFLSIGDGQPLGQAQQLALYNSLRAELLTQPGVCPSNPVRESHRPNGSGGVHTLRCRDLVALQERARALFAKIDNQRSPSIGRPRLNPATGEHVLEVRYYGV
ncbi:hypothetical protein ACUXAV_000355 [Cupriavidus metallidurans]|uniref:hypothetical protein n=1 Tax=Cupriavidus metallidurans TaxID=119219 RepID=UPI00049332F4|nr:hypothetical protein [Cupriavidus metallidurans]MDE4918315.1 hypothetical protein [Cupriavidus metallidurans]